MEENNLNVITKKSKTKTMFALITIIVLFLFLLIVTFTYFNSPRRKFVDTFTKFYNELLEKSSSNNIENILKNDIVGLNGTTTLDINSHEELMDVSSFNKISLEYDYKENKKENIASLYFDSKIINEDFIELEALMKDNKLYFNLKNLIDKYYYTDYEFTSLLSATSGEDAEYVLNILKDVIIDKVTSDYFKSEKTTITVNGKEEKVEKISLEVTDKLLIDILTTIIDELKSDEKAMNILVEYNKMEKEEIIEQFDTTKEMFKNSSSDQKYIYNMYVKGNSKVLKNEFIFGTTTIEYTTYDNIDEIKFIDGSIEQLVLTLKHEDNKTIINGHILNQITVSGDYIDNKLNLNVNIGTMVGKLNIVTVENISTDKSEFNFNGTVSITESNTELLELNINSKNTIQKETAIDEKNITNSVDINNISEEDQQTITNNLMELPIISGILYNLENLKPSMNTIQSIDEY